MFAGNQQIPRYADLPEFARLVEGAMRPVVKAPKPVQSKREDMEGRYRRLESELANYRYP